MAPQHFTIKMWANHSASVNTNVRTAECPLRGGYDHESISPSEYYREVLFLGDKEQRGLNIRLSQGRKLPTS